VLFLNQCKKDSPPQAATPSHTPSHTTAAPSHTPSHTTTAPSHTHPKQTPHVDEKTQEAEKRREEERKQQELYNERLLFTQTKEVADDTLKYNPTQHTEAPVHKETVAPVQTEPVHIEVTKPVQQEPHHEPHQEQHQEPHQEQHQEPHHEPHQEQHQEPHQEQHSHLFERAAQLAQDENKVSSSEEERKLQEAKEKELLKQETEEQIRREEERIRNQFSGVTAKQPSHTYHPPSQPVQKTDPIASTSTPPKLQNPSDIDYDPSVPSVAGGEFGKEIVTEINRARANPRGFAKYLREWESKFNGNVFSLPNTNIALTTNEGVAAVRDAIGYLERIEPVLVPIKYSEALAMSALDLVKDHGPRGKTGDVLSDGTEPGTRLIKYGSWKKKIAETIAYGPLSAKDVIASWIVDDGHSSRPNRESIFDPTFTVVGVASGPHYNYGKIAVVDWTVEFNEGPAKAELPTPVSTYSERPSPQEHKTGVLQELSDGTGFIIDGGITSEPKQNISVKLKKGTELHVVKVSAGKTSDFCYQLPFAFAPDRVTAEYHSDSRVVVKLLKSIQSTVTGEDILAQFTMTTRNPGVNSVTVDIKETKEFFFLRAMPSKFIEDVVHKLKDKKVLIWECKHTIEDEESRKIITATQTIKLPFEVEPSTIRVELHGTEGATTKVPKPTGSDFEADIEIKIV